MANINIPKKIIVHHTGGTDANPLEDTSHHTFQIVDDYHKQKWEFRSSLGHYIGYHYFIDKSGAITQGRADTDEGAHTKGQNLNSLGICLAGNFDLTQPIEAQVRSLRELLQKKTKEHGISKEAIEPHRKYANKTCYGKNLSDEWAKNLLNDVPTTSILDGKKTYIGIAILALTSIAQLSGVIQFTSDKEISDIVMSLSTVIGSIVAIYGRYKSNK